MSDYKYCYCPKCLRSCLYSKDKQCSLCGEEMLPIPDAKNFDEERAFLDDPARKKDMRFRESMYEKAQIKNVYPRSKSSFGGAKCISCGSSNVRKISVASKVGSVAVWGIFAAGRTSKRYHCNKCGTEW